ncbi:MAG: hypothetical protein M0C28_18645 [Candidatus Moduliflexus flocculans]|nr:hypothetical protein [Candidatus Moduliflexus flocculans]
MILNKATGIRIDGRKHMSKTTPMLEYLNPRFVYLPLLQQNQPAQADRRRRSDGEDRTDRGPRGKVLGRCRSTLPSRAR